MKVTQVFPLADRQLIVVHLASFDWNFDVGLRVKLTQGDIVLYASQVGTGNHEGHATLLLRASRNWSEVIPQLAQMTASMDPISIECDGRT